MEYKVSDVASAIESVAPLSLQADYDNSGLVVGRMSDSVSGVLIAVDITEAVIEEAVSLGVDMIVSHHPIIFKGLKRLNSSTCVERCVEMAIRYGITLYAAHTNLDSAPRGMSWRLGEILGLGDMTPLDSDGYGVVADIEECGVEEYIAWVAKALRLQSIRHSEIARDRISRVAICTGSGGSLLGSAIGSGADLYITGDLRYNDFFAAQRELTLLDVGHYESEYCVIEIIFDILSKKMLNFALHKSSQGKNPISYRNY